MKKATSKLAAIIISVAMLVSMLAACDKKPNGGGTFTPPVDEDPYVTELSVVTPPAKTTYKAGQLFDPAGMKLLAKWSHGEEEDIFPSECKKSPTGPLEAGTTAITFTYEGASCTQAITVQSVNIADVEFDFSAINTLQAPGVLDLTAITVTAKYEDGSEDAVSSAQYEMFENEQKIDDPVAYRVTKGSHTITVKFGTYSDSFAFAALEGYSVPVNKIFEESDDAAIAAEIEAKRSFLERPSASRTDGWKFVAIGAYIGEAVQGNILRFHLYSEFEVQAELILDIASSRLIEGGWDSPRKMGEVQFNKAFEISNIKVDQATGKPDVSSGAEQKTPIELDDSVILPGSLSRQGNIALLSNRVDVSFGEIKLEAGYNIVEIKVKDCAEYHDGEGKSRTGNIYGFRVLALNGDEHEHNGVKQNAEAATCQRYGKQEYYRCSICARIFSDAECTDRIFNPLLVQPDDNAHDWDKEHADCVNEQVCTECGTVGETRTAHTFEQDICSYDGDAECTVCHQTFKGGHQIAEANGVIKCLNCDKEFGYKIQAEDETKVTFKKADGSAITPGYDTNTGSNGWSDYVFNGCEGNRIGNMESDEWKGGATINIKVNVDTAGTYKFAMRAQSSTDQGSNNTQNLADIYDYCVNPSGEPQWQAASGTVVAASPEGGWSKLWQWGYTVIAEVELNAGENTVVLRTKARAPSIDYFEFDKKDSGLAKKEAEIVVTRQNGREFSVGGGIEYGKILPGVYVRIAVPDDQIASVGYVYEDIALTADRCTAANFDTSTAGEHSVTFTVEKYGKTYSATFNYTVV